MFSASLLHPVIRYACAAALGLAGAGLAAAADSMVIRKANGSFDDVKADVVLAIENRGLVINNTAHIGAMLERTAGDLGARRKVYEQAQVLEFCSAVISRAAMEADPHTIVFCPYTIAVYTVPGERGTVYVSYRRPALPASAKGAKALQAVDTLLGDIAREAAP